MPPIEIIEQKYYAWQQCAPCRVDINECANSPCKKGGTCIESTSDSEIPYGKFICKCPVGTKGNACEIDINECESSPCQNGGTCKESRKFSNVPYGRFLCQCAPGFTGKVCGTNKNECASKPCKNKGVCTDGINKFTCKCKPGFVGKARFMIKLICENVLWPI